MSTDFTTILLRDFNNLLEEGVDHNVIIQAGEEPNTKSFRAHSGILRARCPYFRTALSETWVKPQEDGVIIFKKPNISAEIFDIILKYIYTDVMKYHMVPDCPRPPSLMPPRRVTFLMNSNYL
ncbi:unnamed protein product [Rhizophagus irregularis]|nr:unnamed protein product [Rhizophagus irregularis]